MAEYYPLLERAVAALPDPTPEARRSIYDRARTALIGQLRSMRPPVPEPDIQRESAALDEAVARVEARFATLPRPAAPPARLAPRPPTTVPPPAPVVSPPLRERPVFTPRPPLSATRAAPGATAAPPAAPTPPAPPPSGSVRAPLSQRPLGSAPKIDIVKAPDASGAAPPTPLPSAATLAVTPLQPAAPASSGDLTSAEATVRTSAEPSGEDAPRDPTAVRPREEGGVRPVAPVRTIPPPRRSKLWLGLAVAVVAAIGVGVLAWRLRDRPEQVLAPRRAAVVADVPGKISGRADDKQGDVATTEGASTGGAVVPAPIAQGDPGGGTQAPVVDRSGTPPPDAPAIPVQQRAAFLVDAPDEPQKVKTYVGSVVWRSDSVSAGQGQPLSTAVRADIDVPEAKLKVSFVLQKNPEPQLPASHTMELKFVPGAGNVLGGIKQINVPELRKDDEPTGLALAGVPVAITDNNFLVGLARGGAEAQNLQRIRERNWFDVSVLLLSGKVGKITFEKGTTGQRIIDDAIKSWQ